MARLEAWLGVPAGWILRAEVERLQPWLPFKVRPFNFSDSSLCIEVENRDSAMEDAYYETFKIM